jgi:hypothetical protein
MTNRSIVAAQTDGSIIVGSIVAGANKPVFIVETSGQVVSGTATIKAGVRDGKPFYDITDVKRVTGH